MRPELRATVEGVDFVPERVAHGKTTTGRKLLERDGAVILTGWPVEQDSTVFALAAMLGARLRELERVHRRTTEDDGELRLHRDGAHIVVEIQDRPVRLRIPDPDYVAVLGDSPARTGGESVVVDGYRLVERIRSDAPALYEFLTTVDVDLTSGVQLPDVHRTPRVARLVEWTRGDLGWALHCFCSRSLPSRSRPSMDSGEPVT